jgi:hypothetical protein
MDTTMRWPAITGRKIQRTQLARAFNASLGKGTPSNKIPRSALVEAQLGQPSIEIGNRLQVHSRIVGAQHQKNRRFTAMKTPKTDSKSGCRLTIWLKPVHSISGNKPSPIQPIWQIGEGL